MKLRDFFNCEPFERFTIFKGNKDIAYKWDGNINKTQKVSTENY
jgi:hypothetical protein